MKFYELISENLTGLGGRMGTERTWDNFRKSFKDDLDGSHGMIPVDGSGLAKAKAFAEEDYKKNSGNKEAKIEWIITDKGFRSPDLLFVMYRINEIMFE
ncbi:MAG: hypothetical protein WC333_00230 [Dehalococcoidia bacterium]